MGLIEKAFGKPDNELENVMDQSADDRALVTFVTARLEEVRNSPARIAMEGIWMTNISYLLGYDGVTYDPQTRQLKPTGNRTRFEKKNRVFVNKILPTIQNRTARLSKNPPKYDVRPNSSDSAEKDLARFKMQVLTMYWDKLKLNRKRIPLYMWLQQCGHSYFKVGFDAELGNVIMDPELGQLQFEGDLRADVVSAFEVYPDPLAKDFDDLTWLIHAKVKKLDYFRTHYPDRGHLVREEGSWLLSAQYEQRINAMSNVSGQAGSDQGATKNTALEIAYYEKRSNKHPMGRMIVVANGVKLDDKPLPVGEIPFAKFDDIIIGGKYSSESVITHARPLQDRKNDLLSAKKGFMSKLLAGKYIAAKGHGLSQESLNDQSGEVVEYTNVPNSPPPQAMTPPQMPQYVFQEEQSIDANFDDIMGINEVSKGQLPAAGIPAIGMQLLTEQDDTRIGIMTESHEESFAVVGKLILLYAQKCLKTKRLLKYAGKSQEITVKEFTGDDLGDGDNDVMVIRGSTLPGSKTLKRQEIMNSWQQGLLGDPADPKVRENVLGMLEFGDVAEMWQDHALDQSQVKKIISMLEQGVQPEPDEANNNAWIWQELNRYRKGDKFDALDPTRQQLVRDYMEAVIKIMMGHADPAIKGENEGVTLESITADNKLGPDQPPPTDPSQEQGVGPSLHMDPPPQPEGTS